MIASRVSLLTRAGAATAATAIALTGAAVTGSAAGAATHHTRKLPTSLSIRLVKHTRDGFDVIRGQLRSHRVPLRHKTVLLESRTATTTFTVVDSARTGAHGVAAFKVTLPAETTKYKLVFAPHPNFRASHSGVVTIRIPSTTPPPPVQLRTSLSIRLVKHPKQGFDVISGQLRSHHVGLDGKTVLLESRTASTTFAVIDTGTTGAARRGPVQGGHPGRDHQVQAGVRGGAGLQGQPQRRGHRPHRHPPAAGSAAHLAVHPAGQAPEAGLRRDQRPAPVAPCRPGRQDRAAGEPHGQHQVRGDRHRHDRRRTAWSRSRRRSPPRPPGTSWCSRRCRTSRPATAAW